MANFIVEDVRSVFRGNNTLAQIIMINIGVFVLLNLLRAFSPNEVFYTNFLPLVGIPGDFVQSLLHFWTYFTYMFAHIGFFHIFWNMLILYWFGRIIGELAGDEKLLYSFVGGGLLGGFFFGLSTLIPGLYSETTLIGASGGVLSVVVAAAVLSPNYTISLILIGPVRIKYLALFLVITTTFIDMNVNLGGKLAHLGGALFGYLYISGLRAGTDYAAPIAKTFAFFRGVFAPKSNMRVVHRNTGSGRQPRPTGRGNRMSETDVQARIDAILDKISRSGYDSLSRAEKDFLANAGKDQ